MLAHCLISFLALTDTSNGKVSVNACNIATLSQGTDACYISLVGRSTLQVKDRCDDIESRISLIGKSAIKDRTR